MLFSLNTKSALSTTIEEWIGSTSSILSGSFISNTATSYYNGDLQTFNTWSGTYANTVFRIGAQISINHPLNGTIQSLIVFPSDKTSDLTALHADIDTYYSIPWII